MCIIIYNEKGTAHNMEHLSNSHENNPHGVGIMWIEDGRVRTLRGLFDKRKMLEILKEFEGVPHALHLRWKTRGKISKENCHPFRASDESLPEKVFLMHNGTFHKVKSTEEQSDTFFFSHSIQAATKKHGTDVLFSEPFLRQLEKEVESWNKVIFLRDDGKVSIVNPKAWHNEDGIWYSNKYSLKAGYRSKKTRTWSRTGSTRNWGAGANYRRAAAVTGSGGTWNNGRWTPGGGSSSVRSNSSAQSKTLTKVDGKVHYINGIAWALGDNGVWGRAASLDTKPANSETENVRLFGDKPYTKHADGIWREVGTDPKPDPSVKLLPNPSVKLLPNTAVSGKPSSEETSAIRQMEATEARVAAEAAAACAAAPMGSTPGDTAVINGKSWICGQNSVWYDTTKSNKSKAQRKAEKRERARLKKLAQREKRDAEKAKREERKIAALEARSNKPSGRVVRRRRHDDGTTSLTPLV